jgi:trehalose synthase
VGLLAPDGRAPSRDFVRRDGTRGNITRAVELLTGPPPPAEAPLLLQASRWDALKDMPGVMVGFADHVAAHTDAHLVLAGPQARGVADDPEATCVLRECLGRWRDLPESVRSRVHLACVPMDDPDEAAFVVNALQRHAAVVAQKSLAEGFGLTVAEAMWKSRPVVGTAVGGIVEQIVGGETGVLLDDPLDLEQFGRAVRRLLDDAAERDRLGRNGRQRAIDQFLGDRHLQQWARVFASLVGD